jgi:hypothetical protein
MPTIDPTVNFLITVEKFFLPIRTGISQNHGSDFWFVKGFSTLIRIL